MKLDDLTDWITRIYGPMLIETVKRMNSASMNLDAVMKAFDESELGIPSDSGTPDRDNQQDEVDMSRTKDDNTNWSPNQWRIICRFLSSKRQMNWCARCSRNMRISTIGGPEDRIDGVYWPIGITCDGCKDFDIEYLKD